jgi:DNA-directed RNA polymerase subunit RPC12/RpoP
MPAGVETISVNCNHCGAPLRVAGGTRYASCTYCGAQLQVHVEGGAAYTEVLEKIDVRTQQIAQDVREIKQHELIEQLDREWAQRRDSFKTRDRYGNERAPGAVASLIAGAFGVICGIIWIAAVNMGGDAIRAPFSGGVHFHDAAGNEISAPPGFVLPGQSSPIGSAMSGMQTLFTLVGVIVIIVSIAGAIYGASKANQFSDAEQAYQRERQRLMDSTRQ